MNRVLVAALLAAATAALSSCAIAGNSLDWKPTMVHRVIDGDTIVVAGVGRVRLASIDTPEATKRVECGGPEATAFVRRLYPRGAYVEYAEAAQKKDRYGRSVGYLRSYRKRVLNVLLVRRGYAEADVRAPNTELAAELSEHAQSAKVKRRGNWRRCGL
jgi:micrococcal nuclease